MLPPTLRKTAVKRNLLAALTVLACTSAWPQSPQDFSVIDAQLSACSERHPDNYGVSNCTVAANAAADRRLNEVYNGALNVLKNPGPTHAPYDPEVPKRLVAAERAWIAFRDAECNFQSTVARGGTGEGYAYVACLYEQTKARVKVLTAPEAPQNSR